MIKKNNYTKRFFMFWIVPIIWIFGLTYPAVITEGATTYYSPWYALTYFLSVFLMGIDVTLMLTDYYEENT